MSFFIELCFAKPSQYTDVIQSLNIFFPLREKIWKLQTKTYSCGCRVALLGFQCFSALYYLMLITEAMLICF